MSTFKLPMHECHQRAIEERDCLLHLRHVVVRRLPIKHHRLAKERRRAWRCRRFGRTAAIALRVARMAWANVNTSSHGSHLGEVSHRQGTERFVD